MTPAKPIRVLIVDDHDFVRRGLRDYLSPGTGIEVVAEAASGREALALVAAAAPDLMLVDISMKEMDGLELTAEVTKRHPSVRVVILSMHDKPLFARRARAAGARGYVSKSAPSAVTLAAVTLVASGSEYFPASSEPAPADPLTARERDVLLLVAKGRQNKEIAEELGIGVKTVETHRLHAREKLGLGTAAQCRAYAEEQGWL